jgi:hypothetical protein
MSANDKQVGGEHYKMDIEPWDAIHSWDLGYFDGTAVKYLSRWKKKNGVQDLHKAKHFIEKLIEVETGESAMDDSFAEFMAAYREGYKTSVIDTYNELTRYFEDLHEAEGSQHNYWKVVSTILQSKLQKELDDNYSE